jgi:hypothetical protein
MLQHLAPEARVALDSGTYDATITLAPFALATRPVGEAVHEPQS